MQWGSSGSLGTAFFDSLTDDRQWRSRVQPGVTPPESLPKTKRRPGSFSIASRYCRLVALSFVEMNRYERPQEDDMSRKAGHSVLTVLVILAFTQTILAQGKMDALGDPLPEGAIARLGTTRMRPLVHPTSSVSASVASPGRPMAR